MIIMPSLSAIEPGGSDPLAYPDYVVLVVGPDGRSYYKVPDEHAAAVAGALNSFQVESRWPKDAEVITLGAARVPGVGNLGRAVADGRRGRGIMLTGDVFSGDWVIVDFVDRVWGAEGMYVLSPPDDGWSSDDDPFRGRPALTPDLKRAVAGWRWGAMIGGVVGIAVIAAHAMRSR